MKKQSFITILFIVLLSLVEANSFAHDIEVPNADGVTIYYYWINNTELAVSCQGSTYDSFPNEYSGDVVIPSSVEYNGNNYNVTRIEGQAFKDCSGLTSITIPNSVKSIGYEAFSGTAWYDNQPDGLFYVGNIAYKYKGEMPNNTTINIKEGTLGISDQAFLNCSGLTSIAIPNSVTSIGWGAFRGCSSLTSITIPSSVTNIEYESFKDCSKLASIAIPNTVTSIGYEAFSGTAWYDNQPDGLIYVGNIAYKYKGEMPNSTTINIKEGTLGIAGQAFMFCTGLASITIPNSVTNIGVSAFWGCSGLTSITIPNSVTAIGLGAFYGCSSLTSITIPESITKINEMSFMNCSGLTSVILPNSVTSIELKTFQNCSSLTSITISNNVTSIGWEAFYGCTGLTSVHITDLESWCNIFFYGTDSNPLSYAHHLYLSGKEITDLVIPNSVSSIGNYAFSYCSGLTSVTIPNSVTSIGNAAFRNCSGLTSITIPNSVTSIGAGAFSSCKLGSVTIGNSVTSIGDDAFSYSELTSITIPGSVTSIGEYAFTSRWLSHVTCYAETVPFADEKAFYSGFDTMVRASNFY